MAPVVLFTVVANGLLEAGVSSVEVAARHYCPHFTAFAFLQRSTRSRCSGRQALIPSNRPLTKRPRHVGKTERLAPGGRDRAHFGLSTGRRSRVLSVCTVAVSATLD